MIRKSHCRKFTAIILSLVLSVPAWATENPTDEKPLHPTAVAPKVPGDDEGTNTWQRIPSELASPWTTGARPWLLWGSALSVGFLIAKDDGNKTQAQLAKDKPLGDWAKVGDYAGQLIPNALYLGGMYTAYWISKDKKYKKHGLIMLKATAYAGAATTFLKVVVKEQRPNKTTWDSFPSGHSTTAFAFASVVAAEHGFWPYGLGAIMLATLTGISRMNDNMHYEHDVIAGATIGTAFGLGVSYINQAFDKKEAGIAVIPVLQDGFAGAHIVLPFPY